MDHYCTVRDTMSGHIARRCSEQKRVRIPAMKVSEWGHLLRALEIERVCH
ncbi:hypothetical protein ACETSC_004246 [Salmonella enterica subsp. enterica serovar Give]